MALFSQRKGFTPLHEIIQRESMNENLRISIMNALSISIWEKWNNSQYNSILRLAKKIWRNFFKKLIDDFPSHSTSYYYNSHYNPWYLHIRAFCKNCEWYQLYDLIEFISDNISDDNWYASLEKNLNLVLERENSAYRLIRKQIVEITDIHEITSIQSALDDSISPTRTHLTKSLEFLSDRENPDYRNSIKEAISAIESDMKWITGNQSATLSDGIKFLKQQHPIRPTFEQALTKLYAYTSNANGIRHALSEEGENVGFAEAKFMFVLCTSFHNYLMALIAENKITLPQQS